MVTNQPLVVLLMVYVFIATMYNDSQMMHVSTLKEVNYGHNQPQVVLKMVYTLIATMYNDQHVKDSMHIQE